MGADLLPSSDEELFAAIQSLGVKLPLTHALGHPGTVTDDDDRIVCVIDPNRERFSDEQASRLATLIVLAVNFAAGA